MQNNEARIVLWTSGCNGGAELTAPSAWLARAERAMKRKTPRVPAARRNSTTLIYAITPIAEGAQEQFENRLQRGGLD
jgi:hypothetical protein